MTRTHDLPFTASLLLVIFFCCVPRSYQAMQCISNSGLPVDWFVIYKLPCAAAPPGDKFVYMDPDHTSWTDSPTTLDNPSQAVGHTLNQIYHRQPQSGIFFAMYNDQPPTAHEDLELDAFGHAKGVYGFDGNTSFWMIHSVPKFPSPNGYSWPTNARPFGQSFLCISLRYDSLHTIVRIFQYSKPHIYYQSWQLTDMYPFIQDAFGGIYEASSSGDFQLRSLGKVRFSAFVKAASFGQDLYSGLLSPQLGSDLMVETWQRGRGNKLPSNCTGQYKVNNINAVEIRTRGNIYRFSSMQDHSKWAVAVNTHSQWTCIGDINRMKSQMGRPGGAVCLSNNSVWKIYKDSISTYEVCL